VNRRSLLRTIGINIIVFFSLLGMIAFLPTFVVDIARLSRDAWNKAFSPQRVDYRSVLPNYRGQDWAKVHFNEFSSLRSTYYDFFTYRRDRYQGQTITIDDDGYRISPDTSKNDRLNADVWFFGASTMWGTGLRDAETIPAVFESLTGFSSFNFGESGYVVQQSLNLLMKNYAEGGRPKIVVFYDGVADIEHKCRVNQDFFSSSQIELIRSVIGTKMQVGNAGDFDALLTARVLSPSLGTVAGAEDSVSRTVFGGYDCDTDARKRARIADAFVNGWMTANWFVKQQGASFIPILQPVAMLGEPDLRHLPGVARNEALRRQFKAVYDEIRSRLAAKGFRYLDMTQIFNGDELIYIDYAHVSPNGARIVAQSLASALRINPEPKSTQGQ